MIKAVKICSEPNNLSPWDFLIDPDWTQFATIAKRAVHPFKEEYPQILLVMSGISPIDPKFVQFIEKHGILGCLPIFAEIWYENMQREEVGLNE